MGHGGVGYGITDPENCKHVQCGMGECDGDDEVVYLEFPVKPYKDLAGISNAMASSHHGMYIMCPLQWKDKSIEITMLIDSGATASLLNECIYELIPVNLRPKLLSAQDIKVTLADGSVQLCKGKATLPLKIGSTWKSVEFLLVAGLIQLYWE